MCIGTGQRLFFGYFMPRAFGTCVQCHGEGTIEESFRCPQCGSPYFGREILELRENDFPVLGKYECHGSSSGPIVYGDERGRCSWRGDWPVENPDEMP